ncbi:MAG: hypothetical protein C6H99_02975 [Epsilonproteobacteria bacterium]|nr:hypothetical protein [Campylobacterota bacterium]NPA64218.1 hypothetical protein [Campylobacterota bacterium]
MHQIFGATFRYLSDSRATYTIKAPKGLKIVYDKTPARRDDLYTYKTIYFKALHPKASLPSIVVTTRHGTFHIPSRPLTVTTLKPPKDFCGVLAKDLKILKHQAIQYNKELNLIVMRLGMELGNGEDFHLPYAQKEQIKEYNLTFPSLKILYYAIIPSSITKLKFSYFDTDTREFKRLFFDIRVKDESVSTQSDIKPTEDRHKTLKIVLIASLGGVLVLLAIWKRSWLSGLFGVGLIALAIYLSIPLKKVCVKKGSKIYILPTKKSTIFRINHQRRSYIKLNEVNGYIKIKLSQDRIGWVKNEDICQN